MESYFSKDLNFQNPLDALEEIIFMKQWPCSRANDYELISEIKGNHCLYRLYIVWSESINAISLTITFDLTVPPSSKSSIFELLSLINENLWMGHFDVTSKSGIPAYRNTFLIKDKNIENIRIMEDIVDIGINDCEKFYPSFQMVLWENSKPDIAAATCLMETKGRA